MLLNIRRVFGYSICMALAPIHRCAATVRTRCYPCDYHIFRLCQHSSFDSCVISHSLLRSDDDGGFHVRGTHSLCAPLYLIECMDETV